MASAIILLFFFCQNTCMGFVLKLEDFEHCTQHFVLDNSNSSAHLIEHKLLEMPMSVRSIANINRTLVAQRSHFRDTCAIIFVISSTCHFYNLFAKLKYHTTNPDTLIINIVTTDDSVNCMWIRNPFK